MARVLITGASRGIGHDTSLLLARAGHEGVATMRSPAASDLEKVAREARVHLPGGTAHWFRFGARGGEMLSITSRLGASRMFADMAREVAPVDPDLGRLAEVCGRHGLKFVV